jgi:hypothetical protein
MLSMQRRHAAKPRLLRYRFDSLDQLERHLHTVKARTLLFFPNAIDLRMGDLVTLEIGVIATGPVCLLRGRVYGIEDSIFQGAWLEFATSAVVGAIKRSPQARARRLPSHVFVRVEREREVPLLCRLEDISDSGARVSGLGAQLSTGEALKFSVMGKAGSWNGRVCWSRWSEAGVEFSASQWQMWGVALADRLEATEHRHFSACDCLHGRREEPSVPRGFLAGWRAERFTVGRVA